jgi:hypothetical protein
MGRGSAPAHQGGIGVGDDFRANDETIASSFGPTGSNEFRRSGSHRHSTQPVVLPRVSLSMLPENPDQRSIGTVLSTSKFSTVEGFNYIVCVVLVRGERSCGGGLFSGWAP